MSALRYPVVRRWPFLAVALAYVTFAVTPAQAIVWWHNHNNGSNNGNQKNGADVKVSLNRVGTNVQAMRSTFNTTFTGYLAVQVPTGTVPDATGFAQWMLQGNNTIVSAPVLSAQAAARAQAFQAASFGMTWIGWEVGLNYAGIDLSTVNTATLYAIPGFTTPGTLPDGTIFQAYLADNGDTISGLDPMEHMQEVFPSAPLAAPEPGPLMLLMAGSAMLFASSRLFRKRASMSKPTD